MEQPPVVIIIVLDIIPNFCVLVQTEFQALPGVSAGEGLCHLDWIYRTDSSPSWTSTVRSAPGSTWSAIIFRPMRVSTVCWRYRRRGRAP